MKTNDKWNPANVPTTRPSEDQLNRSSMPLLGEWPSALGTVETAGFSPDGRFYWTGGSVDKTVRLYDTESGEFLHEFRTGDYPTFCARILSDGLSLCTLDQDSRLRLFNIKTGNIVFEHSVEFDFIDATDISPDGQKVMICFSQKPGVCFDIAPGETKPTWMVKTADGCATRLVGAVFSPDGTLLVGKTNDEEIGIWRCEDGVLQKIILDEDNAFEIHPVQLSHDNSKLLCLDWENDRALLLNVADGSTIHDILCDSTLAVARLSPDSRWIATGTREGQLALWSAETGEKIRDFLKSDKEIRCLDFSPDNRLLISGGKDGLARLWNVETGEEIRTHEGHQGDIFWQALSRDGRFLAYFDNSEVRVINLETRSRIARIRAGAASDLRFGDDLQTISFNDFSREAVRVILIYTVDGKHLYDKNEPDTEEWLEASARTHTADREFYLKREEMLKKRMLGIPVSSGSTTIDVYRSTDNQIAQQFKIPYECKHGCQWFAPGGNRIIATEPRGFHIGNRETGGWELFLDNENGKGVQCVDISPDGTLLAAGLANGTIRFWHLIDRCWVRSLEGHPTAVAGISASNGVLFSKDGTRLMTTDLDYTFVWDVATGKCLGSIFKDTSHAGDDRDLEQFDEGFSDNLDVFLIKKGEGRGELFVYQCDLQYLVAKNSNDDT